MLQQQDRVQVGLLGLLPKHEQHKYSNNHRSQQRIHIPRKAASCQSPLDCFEGWHLKICELVMLKWIGLTWWRGLSLAPCMVVPLHSLHDGLGTDMGANQVSK